MKCLECKKDLEQTQGKRAKQFCNSTCRSNYWQKENRKLKSEPKVNIKDLTKNTHEASNKPQPAPKPEKAASSTKNENGDELSSFERLRRKRMGYG
jgi:hypothetical protein